MNSQLCLIMIFKWVEYTMQPWKTVKCGTSGILLVSRRERKQVDDLKNEVLGLGQMANSR